MCRSALYILLILLTFSLPVQGLNLAPRNSDELFGKYNANLYLNVTSNKIATIGRLRNRAQWHSNRGFKVTIIIWLVPFYSSSSYVIPPETLAARAHVTLLLTGVAPVRRFYV